MNEPLVVDLREFFSYRKYLTTLNKAKSLKFMLDGKELQLTPSQLEEWRFTGLTNASMIDAHFGFVSETL